MIEEIKFWCFTHSSPADWEMNGGNLDVLRCWWDQLAVFPSFTGSRGGRGSCKFSKATVEIGTSWSDVRGQ